ncbi:MAG: asparaginase [Cyclobacteriaceae bacterium]
MKYEVVNINEVGERKILIIYTGGTFGMVLDDSGSLAPFNFSQVVDRIPELQALSIKLSAISFSVPIDSSNIMIEDWVNLCKIIEDNYEDYDGFVILHGTDTMAYTASMLSFMLQGLNKPVILTGAQMPIGSVRSDARENLITALEIASVEEKGHPVVSEVCIYFNFILLRGNRSQKIRSSQFAAFESENYPYLAEAGISIDFNHGALSPYLEKSSLNIIYDLDPNVTILKIFPGITEGAVRGTIFASNLKGMILESFGSGNTMSSEWFLNCLREGIEAGLIILNVSQCLGGQVMQGRYETSKKLNEIGVLSGGDITTEAAVAKLMLLLGSEKDRKKLKRKLTLPQNGEMNV